MGTKDIVIPGTTPAAAAEALKKTGYNVKIQAEGDNTEAELKDGKDDIHTKKWDRCTKKIKSSGKSEERAAKICSSSIKNAGVQASHQQKSGKQYVANRKEVTEGDTLLDVFPELNQQVPEEGGEPIKVDPTTPKLKKTTIEKEVKPKGAKSVKKENKITTKLNVMDNVVTKKDLMEMIRSAQPAQPATKPGQSPAPTIAPSKPERRDKPERKNPFKPKPGSKPKGQLMFDETKETEDFPNWLKSDKLGIGKSKETDESIAESIIRETLNKRK
jgi:hypothetical protein